MVMGKEVVDITSTDFFSSHNNHSSLLGVSLRCLDTHLHLGVLGQQLKVSCLLMFLKTQF